MIFISGRLFPGVKWEAVMACINPEFFSGRGMRSSHNLCSTSIFLCSD